MTGDRFFPALLDAIAQARHEVLLETYEFFDDPTGQRVAEALAAAAARGVRVCVVVDGYGSSNVAPAIRTRLGGATLRIYRPWEGLLAFRRARLRRLHRKLCVVDARVGFCGGINIRDDRDGDPQAQPRYDFAVCVEGPIVAEMHATMRRLWRILEWTQTGRRPRVPAMPPNASSAPAGPIRARFVVRENLRHRRAIEQAYRDAVATARHEILVSNAYFLPGRNGRHLLRDARRRGVRVRLLLQGQVEYFMVHHAMRALYGAMLKWGVEVHDYRPAWLHAKVAVIDGRWATVGSSNIDPFSLVLSREANVVVEDEGFAQQLRDELDRAIREDADAMDADRWKRRAWLVRVLDWAAYQGVRVLAGFTGGGKGESG